MKFENTKVYNFEGALHGMRNPKESHHLSDSKYDFYNLLEGDAPPTELLKVYPSAYITEKIYDFHGNLICYKPIIIGEKDMELAQTLIRAGAEHRKFMRQIFVSVDITAPLYWWKEFDTYKVGAVANSTSTMHKITSKPITLECFEIDDYSKDITYECQENMQLPDEEGNCWMGFSIEKGLIPFLEKLRVKHLEYVEKIKCSQNTDAERKHFQRVAKKYWKELIRWLPESWLQTRTVTMTYENLYAMCSKGQRRFHKLNEWSGIDNDTVENFINFARKLPYAKELIFIDELNYTA